MSPKPWQQRAAAPKELIEQLAEEMKIDVSEDWWLDQAFLELHTKDQLLALCKEWKWKGEWPEKRAELIAAMLEREAPSAPKLLLKVTAKDARCV
jgi:hypothetical protein